jgi:hypothetical protein
MAKNISQTEPNFFNSLELFSGQAWAFFIKKYFGFARTGLLKNIFGTEQSF